MRRKRNYIGLLFTTAMTVLFALLKYFKVLPWQWHQVFIPFGIGLFVWVWDVLIRYFENRSLNAANKAIRDRIEQNAKSSHYEKAK